MARPTPVAWAPKNFSSLYGPHRRSATEPRGAPEPEKRKEDRIRALTYHGSKDVRVENVADPRIEQDDDIAEAPRGYEIFNDKKENCRKVVLHAA